MSSQAECQFLSLLSHRANDLGGKHNKNKSNKIHYPQPVHFLYCKTVIQ